jgi:hypothetical protein
VRALRDELREAAAEREASEDYAGDLHAAARSSIVNRTQANAVVAPRLRKSGVDQVSVWSGWTGADRVEIGEDVRN